MISVVNSWGLTIVDTSTGGVLTIPISPADGNSLIVGVFHYFDATYHIASVKDNHGSNLIQDLSEQVDSGNSVSFSFWRLQNCSSETSVIVTMNLALGGYLAGYVLEVSNLNSLTPTDAFSTGVVGGSANPYSYNSVTTTNANDLVLGFGFCTGSDPLSAFSPWSLARNVSGGLTLSVAYQVVSSIATYTPKATTDGISNISSISGAYQAAPSALPPPSAAGGSQAFGGRMRMQRVSEYDA